MRIYFDIEDDPTQHVAYLFGMWIRRAGGEGAFEYILAERPADEKAACQFLRRWHCAYRGSKLLLPTAAAAGEARAEQAC